MPYDIAKDFDGCAYAVVKMTPGGKELAPGGCHPTAIEAGKHLAALEAATSYEGRAAGEWVIVDIDGTLTVSDGSDEPRESLVSWMRANDYSYAIVSARPDSRLDETRAWLESNDIPHSSVSLSDFPQGPNAGVAFKKSKAEQLLKNHKIAFAIDNDPAARSAYESAGVKAVGPTTVRYFQLGLELRHPGHADQSAHNPHKGGAGAFVPGAWKEQPIPTREEHLARIKANYAGVAPGRKYTAKEQEVIDANTQKIADLTYPSVSQTVIYKNGPVTLGVDKDAAAPLTLEMRSRMDSVIAETQAKYPGEMSYTWTNLTGREATAMGAARIGSRAIDFDSGKMTERAGQQGYGSVEYTMWHETGHAVPMRGFPEPSAGVGMGFQIDGDVLPLINDYSSVVAGKLPQVRRLGSDDTAGVASVISAYATTDPVEMHAEIFAQFHFPLPDTGKFKRDVIAAYGEVAGWKP